MVIGITDRVASATTSAVQARMMTAYVTIQASHEIDNLGMAMSLVASTQ